MTGVYTVTSGGDFLWRNPIAKRISPQLRDVMRNADTTVGNLEGQIIDPRNCVSPCTFASSWMPKEAAQAYADLGLDFIAPGEFNGGLEGHLSSQKYLEDVGIKMSGAGRNLTIARQPAFQELPQGRVAFLTACPGIYCGPAAANDEGMRGTERPGVNPLRLTVWTTVTKPQFDQLNAIRESILARRHEPDVLVPTDLPKDPPGRLRLLGERFVIGDKPGEFRYDVDPNDEQAQILAVRNAKELADFVIFTMHNHTNRYAFQAYSHDNYPAEFMRSFIHKLIDNGLDMYVGHGSHTMQGIEIYKGRPIFYNHGNLGDDRFGPEDSPPNPGNLTNTERLERNWAWIQHGENSIAFLAHTRYQDGRLAEILIYPADLGLVGSPRRPLSRANIPMTPTPAMAREILEKIQKYSEPFGTKISIENNIGIIRVPPEATVEIGGDLVIPGRGPR
jgi:poly-gamma-glutamate synthesis protein (capsule biosynthesis protein)